MSTGTGRPLGHYFAIGICLIVAGVILGVIGVAVSAKRQQRYRTPEAGPPSAHSNATARPALLPPTPAR